MSEAQESPSETVAAHVRELRGDDLSQRGLARRMVQLGHRWNDSIVSRVERGERDVSVNELVALGLILGASPSEFLMPGSDVAVGGVTVPQDLYAPWLEARFGKLWLSDAGKLTYDSDLAFEFFKRQGLIIEEDQ